MFVTLVTMWKSFTWCQSRACELSFDEMKCNDRRRHSDLAQVRRRFSDVGQSHQCTQGLEQKTYETLCQHES